MSVSFARLGGGTPLGMLGSLLLALLRSKRLERDGSDICHRGAEIIFHRILLIIGLALEAAGVATQKINPLWFVGERFQLQRKRLSHVLNFNACA